MNSGSNMMIDLKSVVDKVVEVARTPAGWLSALLIYLAPLSVIYILMITVVVADFITGMLASWKRMIPRSSGRLKNSIVKVFCYFGAVYIFWQMEVRIGLEYLQLGSYKIIGGFIAIVETISILENMAIITGHPIFLKIIKFVRGKAAEKGGSLIEDILEEKTEESKKKD